MSDALRLDLHVHSRHSPDSRLSITGIAEAISVAGLDGFALTDHNTVAGHVELARVAASNPRLRIVPGVEVSTREGHVLALGVVEAPPPYRPVDESIRWIVAHGGVAVPSHPMRWVHGIGARTAERVDVPALETVNGHNGAVTNGRAELLAARRGIGATGGSDAHERRDVGRAFTELPPDLDSVDAVLEALRSHRTRGAGSSLSGSDRARLAVRTWLNRAARGFRSL